MAGLALKYRKPDKTGGRMKITGNQMKITGKRNGQMEWANRRETHRKFNRYIINLAIKIIKKLAGQGARSLRGQGAAPLRGACPLAGGWGSAHGFEVKLTEVKTWQKQKF